MAEPWDAEDPLKVLCAKVTEVPEPRSEMPPPALEALQFSNIVPAMVATAAA